MTLRRLVRLAFCCAALVPLAPAALAEDYPPSVRGRVEMSFDLSHQPSTGETRLWIPYPLSDPHQWVTNARWEGDFEEAAVYSDRTFSTPMLYARWPEEAKSRTLTFAFEVERKEIRMGGLPPREAAWSLGDHALWLQPTRLGPTDGPVKRAADEVTKGKEGILEKARALYEWTCRSTYRDPATRGCGEGDVCKLLETPGGKCADIHSVFVAMARAAGVPAREVFGLRMGKEDGQDVTTWQHCWAEFYLPGHGWVVVDPADVRKGMLQRGLGPSDPVPEDLMAYYWGGVDPYRVKLGVGRDLTLTPPQEGGPVNYLMYPFAQVGTTTLDWLDPKSFRYRVTYHTL
jgi:transglutaminase-like putative cysteine protease